MGGAGAGASPAGGAGPGVALGAAVPQRGQKANPAARGVPQEGQPWGRWVPQWGQNAKSAEISFPHW